MEGKSSQCFFQSQTIIFGSNKKLKLYKTTSITILPAPWPIKAISCLCTYQLSISNITFPRKSVSLFLFYLYFTLLYFWVFILFPSSGTYFSAVSSSLTFYVSGLLSSGCSIIVFLFFFFFCFWCLSPHGWGWSSSLCKLPGWSAFPLVDGAGSCPFGGQCQIKVYV